MSIIKEFYEGDMRPSEVNFKNGKYNSAFTQYEQLSEKLKSTLSKKQLKLFDGVISRFFTMEFEYGKEMFAVGYSLGVKFTAESFCTKTQ